MGWGESRLVSLRQMDEVDGNGTLEGCLGMAWGVGGREARFLLGLGAAGKFPDSRFPHAELQWWVRVEGNPCLIKGEWKRLEWGRGWG